MEIIKRIKDIIFKIKDYDRLESDYCTCLCYFTNNKMSKPNYKIDAVETVISDSIGEYMDEGYNEATRKAIEWISNNFRQSPYDNTKVVTHFASIQEAVDEFKKYMKGE